MTNYRQTRQFPPQKEPLSTHHPDEFEDIANREDLVHWRHGLGMPKPQYWVAAFLLLAASMMMILSYGFPRQNNAAMEIHTVNAVAQLPAVATNEEQVSFTVKDSAVATGWKIVCGHNVNVRMAKITTSGVLESKPKCAILFGKKEGAWIKLQHEPGYMLITRLLKKTRVTFTKIRTGTCRDIKQFPVMERSACQTAALVLGLTVDKTILSREAAQPEGCFWKADDLSLWLNALPINRGNGAVGARHSICWHQNPCYSGLNCLVQTAFGSKYTSLSNKYTLPNKIRYSSAFSYRVIVIQQPTKAELLGKEFGDCFPGVNLNELDVQTVLKVCSIMKGFRAGCQTVMWTDADAAVLSDTPFDFWMRENPTANVYWSVSDIGAKEKCMGWNSPTGCHAYQDFVSCLNAGAVIFRNSFWTEYFLYRVLARSRHLSDPFCDTSPFNTRGFDQCALPGAPDSGDQCAITCEVMADPSVMANFECLSDRMSPVFQAVALSPDWMHLLRKDVFIGNCILKDKMACIQALVDLGRLKTR